MYYFNNSRDRTALDQQEFKGIKFKVLFPTYDDWKNSLKVTPEITDAMIKQSDYEFLATMIGNSYLRYDTESKNKYYINYEFLKLTRQKERENILYVKTFDDRST